MASPFQTRLLSAAVLVLVFGSGAVVGFATGRAGGDEVATAGEAEGEEEAPTEGETRRRTPLYEQVGLRDDQKGPIDSIVAAHRERVDSLQKAYRPEWERADSLRDAIRAAFYPEWRAITEDTRAAIKSVMDADQVARYDSLLAEADRRNRSDEDETGN